MASNRDIELQQFKEYITTTVLSILNEDINLRPKNGQTSVPIKSDKVISKPSLNEESNLDQLISGISTNTLIGQRWSKLITSLESIMSEVSDFNSQFQRYKPLPNTAHAIQRLNELVKVLAEIKPVIIGMDKVSERDHRSE